MWTKISRVETKKEFNPYEIYDENQYYSRSQVLINCEVREYDDK